MKYKLTPLNTAAILFLLFAVIFTAVRYDELSKDEGWGIVAMITLSAYALLALLVDLIIQRLIVGRREQLILTTLVLLLFIALLFIK